ncbi:hypothetical protein A1O1_07134 [Capronia coronata CBS 617.96]|uniref:Uncharacterized protein n=1 Tax=Capronia coronata CBS 617.96 TaxID=1182541 RepID=W9Y2Q6_9EURO|nr:uncharacterized protein A1O1_07134 [Capronia coronata CBS 617.96]EXJ83511.1 hypothetical protein A1O1_07134 [Capronia coronata CBS 617.96]
MSRQVPRLQLFGGDHRSSAWFGLAKLLMHDEYLRVEAIRRSRRGRAKRASQSVATQTSAAEGNVPNVPAGSDADAGTGDPPAIAGGGDAAGDAAAGSPSSEENEADGGSGEEGREHGVDDEAEGDGRGRGRESDNHSLGVDSHEDTEASGSPGASRE